ncbi:hypothetical protein, partial [Hoeflea sp. EC-HK425]|uniref:hypothetical protein n=1 Tax=Hoeflea sp. EC-HK425 TaxID=2038388 RepID=UPI001AEFAEC5
MTLYVSAIHNKRISIHYYEVMGGRQRKIKNTVYRDHGRGWPEDRHRGCQQFSVRRQKEPAFGAFTNDPSLKADRVDLKEIWKLRRAQIEGA